MHQEAAPQPWPGLSFVTLLWPAHHSPCHFGRGGMWHARRFSPRLLSVRKLIVSLFRTDRFGDGTLFALECGISNSIRTSPSQPARKCSCEMRAIPGHSVRILSDLKPVRVLLLLRAPKTHRVDAEASYSAGPDLDTCDMANMEGRLTLHELGSRSDTSPCRQLNKSECHSKSRYPTCPCTPSDSLLQSSIRFSMEIYVTMIHSSER